jgi:hypothetical protein
MLASVAENLLNLLSTLIQLVLRTDHVDNAKRQDQDRQHLPGVTTFVANAATTAPALSEAPIHKMPAPVSRLTVWSCIASPMTLRALATRTGTPGFAVPHCPPL